MPPTNNVSYSQATLFRVAFFYYFFPATGGYGRSGVPDIVCCVSGQFLGIECKAGTNPPTALQVRELENIALANGLALVVNENTIDALDTVLENITGLPVMKGVSQDLRDVADVVFLRIH